MTMLELLELLLRRAYEVRKTVVLMDTLYPSGLCGLMHSLYYWNVYSQNYEANLETYKRLEAYIMRNKPENPYSNTYFFPPYDWNKRIEFLKELIKKESE